MINNIKCVQYIWHNNWEALLTNFEKMNKYDYFISGVWKDSNDRITHVLLHKVTTDASFNRGSKKTENEVIMLLKSGQVIFTIKWLYPVWSLGAKVMVVTDHNREYLRTAPNTKTQDNLDNLISMQNIHNG